MNKGELVDAVANRLNETKTNAQRLVDAVLESIIEGVQKDDKVAVSGFGTFKKRRRKARTGINPATKQPIHIEASTTVGFTASSTLRNGV